MPPAASTSSMCTLLDGETLQILGHLAEMALMLFEIVFYARFIGDGQRMQDGIGRAAHRHIEDEGVMQRFFGDDIEGL